MPLRSRPQGFHPRPAMICGATPGLSSIHRNTQVKGDGCLPLQRSASWLALTGKVGCTIIPVFTKVASCA
jgi:hypothetical protein